MSFSGDRGRRACGLRVHLPVHTADPPLLRPPLAYAFTAGRWGHCATQCMCTSGPHACVHCGKIGRKPHAGAWHSQRGDVKWGWILWVQRLWRICPFPYGHLAPRPSLCMCICKNLTMRLPSSYYVAPTCFELCQSAYTKECQFSIKPQTKPCYMQCMNRPEQDIRKHSVCSP